MKNIVFCSILIAALGPALPAFAAVDYNPVPLLAETTAGGSVFTGPLSASARKMQFLINESQIADLVGTDLVGLTFRLPPALSTAWPASSVTFSSFDIYLGQSVAPADRSLTFVDNGVGAQTQVRSGALEIQANSFTSTTETPSDWGMTISFTAWTYSGGHLLVEIRHGGFSGTSRSVEAYGTATAGYASLYSGLWSSTHEATAGLQANFSTLALVTAAVPEPASAALMLGGVAMAFGSMRRRRR